MLFQYKKKLYVVCHTKSNQTRHDFCQDEQYKDHLKSQNFGLVSIISIVWELPRNTVNRLIEDKVVKRTGLFIKKKKEKKKVQYTN